MLLPGKQEKLKKNDNRSDKKYSHIKNLQFNDDESIRKVTLNLITFFF